MKYLKVFEEETTKKPENLKELKKIIRKASNDFKRTVTVKKLNMNEKEYYENPDNFEKLEQIDVYLGPMRKKLIIDVKGNKAEFTSKEVDELLNAITLAKSKM